MLHARRHFALALLASTFLVFVLGQDRYQYVRHVKGCVDGLSRSSNPELEKYPSKTQSECAALCDAYGNGCKGFEFGVYYDFPNRWKGLDGPNRACDTSDYFRECVGYDPGDCLLQSSDFNVYRRHVAGQYSTEESGCNGAYYNLDFYTKDSNAPMTTTWTFTTIQQPATTYYDDDDGIPDVLQEYPIYLAVGIAVFLCCVLNAIKVRRSLKTWIIYLITKPTLIPFSRRVCSTHRRRRMVLR
jgi:hypothetical protein